MWVARAKPVADRSTSLPEFSNPIAITNPLFPVSAVRQVIQLGVDGGLPLRVEVTLMSETRTIEWEGRRVETLVSQFISYRDRRILERLRLFRPSR